MRISKWLQHGLRTAAVIALFFDITGCRREAVPKKINLENRQELHKELHPQGQSLRIAVGGMITPKAGFGYYRQFLDYIGSRLGMHVEFVDRDNYEEINKLVKSGEVDVAFVCGGPYVDGHDDFGMELLAAPQAYGGTVYYSYIIVGRDSALARFEDLRGKRFAFTDPLSNTGKLVPTYLLAKMRETPDTFFGKYIFTQSHDKAIQAVAQGIADGAAVDSLIWEYANRTNPEHTSRTRIIRKSAPYGIPPVVVRKGMDPGLKARIGRVFLDAHQDALGKKILESMMIDRFVPIEDSAYDTIRDMKKWVARMKNSGKGKVVQGGQ